MVAGLASAQEIKTVLDTIPQQHPFRYIERIVELSEDHAVAEYTYSPREYFFAGHFPGNPVTPGVILLETMAQTGLVALGTFILLREDRLSGFTTLFTDCQAEFRKIVRPNTKVTVKAQKIFWRRNKLKSQVELWDADQLAAVGTISGMGVPL